MGRSRKNKRKEDNDEGRRPRKKMRGSPKQRFWILDCQDSKRTADEESHDIELLITRCELLDDYRQRSMDAVGVNQEDAENEVTKTADDSGVNKNEEDNIEKDCPDPEGSPLIHFFDPKDSITPLVETHVEQMIVSSPAKATIEESKFPKIFVKKSRSAKRPFPKVLGMVENFRHLPNGDCGDGVVNPHSKNEVPDKYWSQRRRLFTLFDKGIQLDKESWYSVTPEVIANHIANHLVAGTKDIVLFDPFCGCGGNAIAFASRPEVKMVVCIDKDAEKLKKAHHNASIYGVEKKLLLISGNALTILSKYKDGHLIDTNESSSQTVSLPKTLDVIFLSPPWGGIDYGKVGKHSYDLTCIKIELDDGNHLDGETLLKYVAKASGHKAVAYFLPKNINGMAFAQSVLKAGYGGPIVMEQNVVNGKLKTVTSYIGLGSE